MRGRGGGRKGGNPRNNSYESNGPDVKVRGNPQQIVEKYLALARDASSAGDRINAESYYQFAEHYYRIMNANAAAAEQQRQPQNPAQDGEADASNNTRGAEGAENAENSDAVGEDGEKAPNGQNGRSRRRNNRGNGRNSQAAEDVADHAQPDVTAAEEAPSDDTGDNANT